MIRNRRIVGPCPSRSESGRAGSVILVLFLGTVCGLAWAVFDFQRAGGNLDQLASRVERQLAGSPDETSAGARAPRTTGAPAAVPKRPVARPAARPAAGPPPAAVGSSVPETVAATPAGAVTDPARQPADPQPVVRPAAGGAQPVRVDPGTVPPQGAAADSLPFDVVFKALRESEADLKAARFEEARNRLARFDGKRVPDKLQAEFKALRARCELHATLLRETNLTPSQEPPKLTEIEFRVPKGPFTGTLLAQDDKKVEVLLLSNIAVTFETFEILQMKAVDPLRARRMVEAEFERRKKRLSTRRPMDAFRLGEFCLRNGLPEKVVECFDTSAEVAEQAGVDLLKTVRDEKAEGLYDTFVFFLSIGNLSEARSTLDLMRLRYPDSPCIARAEDMERDTMKVATAELSSKIKPKAVEIVSAAPAAAPPAEAAVSAPAGATPAAVQTPAPPAVEEPPPAAPIPADKQAAFKKCVDEANGLYDKAVEHLKRSDPSINPDNWLKENNTAEDLLTKAYALYNQALDLHNDPSLWDRVRDTNFKRVLCRKRQINK